MHDIPEVAAKPDGRPDNEPERATGRGRLRRRPGRLASRSSSGKPSAAAQEHHDAWLRAKAEADNIRKRAQTEIASAHKFALENFATELLAGQGQPRGRARRRRTPPVESMRSGVELTLKQLAAVFERFNLTEINPVGPEIRPAPPPGDQHRWNPTPSRIPCVQVLQKGYLLHDRVIRPALVIVAKAGLKDH